MKAKELAEKLLEHPDFEVDFRLWVDDGTKYGKSLKSFSVDVNDIGYSSKIIILGEE